MKAATALAMQSLAFGSMLFERNPAFISLAAAYPSMMVYWPEPKMATPFGPSSA